ncbi:MAG TPA: response regulator [Bacteroidetes bacterium]|nr:response regulator [Bacteroidota bacterium]
MQLLLIDPNLSNLQVYQDVFESWGFQVTTCSKKSDLREMVLSVHTFGVIITDLDLPGAKKGQLIPWLKEMFPDTAILVLTEKSSIQSAIQAIRNGADDYIQRPFSLEKIREKLAKTIEGKKRGQTLFDIEEDVSQIFQTMHRIRRINQNFLYFNMLNRIFYEHISEAVLILNGNGEILIINQRMKDLLGIAAPSLNGAKLFRQFPGLKTSVFHSLFMSHLGSVQEIEYRDLQFNRPGEEKKLNLNVMVLSLNSERGAGQEAGIIFIVNQIKYR